MTDAVHDEGRAMDHRTLLAGGAGAVIAAGLVASLAEATRAAPQPGAERSDVNAVIETVTGPIRGRDVQWALEHEHLFVDFDGAKDPSYQDVDWSDVTGACVNSVSELLAQGVNLFVDYTPAGVGRNARLIRDVARRTGMSIVCASGIYRASFGTPPEFRDFNADQLADHFVRELTLGVEGTSIRAGFIKIAVDDDGPKPGRRSRLPRRRARRQPNRLCDRHACASRIRAAGRAHDPRERRNRPEPVHLGAR